jgi:hypothetical protein
MAGQVSPGIVLRERDLTAQTIVNTQANTAALVGSFEKGPVGTITNISTERELVEYFGRPNNSNYEDWFTASTFLSYGGQLQVVRIEDALLKNAVSEAGSVITDATKLFVVDADPFTVGDVVKVDDEYFEVTAKSVSGSENLTVTRARLGSTAVDHAAGATVTKWSFSNSATTTVVSEALDSSENLISLTSGTGFTAGSYVRLTNSVDSTTEIVRIEDIEGNDIVVTRGQLGTSAVAQPVSTITATLLTFAATASTTTLSEVYPVVTTTGVSAPLIKSSRDFEVNQSTYSWKFAARTAGTWANNIKVAVIDGGVSGYDNQNIDGTSGGSGVRWNTIAVDPGTANDMHVLVLSPSNEILESHLFVSRLSNAVDEQGSSSFYANVINRKSAYIYVGSSAPAAGNNVYALSAGIDAYTTNVSSINSAYDLFSDTEEIGIDFVLGGGSLQILADQRTKAQYAINLAASRKDCIAFVSPHKGFISLSSTSAQRDAIISFFDPLTSTSYAVFDNNYKYIYDRYNDTYRYIPCNADVAGLCVQTSLNLEDWYSPSGLNRGNLQNAVKLAYVPTKTDRDKLYIKRINPITYFPGQGTVLYGDKTALSTPSAFDRINVRRLFLAVEKRIGALAKTVLFELNDSATRASFANAASSYLAEVRSKRGVTDYLVVCDETNNTADVIDRNEFVAEIYIKPARSINYITITFVATRSGVSFSEVTGR